jgi:hypothetical protein
MHQAMKTFEYPNNMNSHKVAMRYPLNLPPRDPNVLSSSSSSDTESEDSQGNKKVPLDQDTKDKINLFGRLICQAVVFIEKKSKIPQLFHNYGHYYAGDFDKDGFKHGKGIYFFGGGEGYY